MIRFIWSLVAVAMLGIVLCKPHENDSKSRRSVLQFKNLLECATKKSGWKYEGYGCWCAFNGKGEPVDDIDRCCKAHDECYQQIKDGELCEWPHEYSVYYLEYKKTKDCLECAPASEYDVKKEANCKTKLCECDVKAAKCVQKAKYNKEFAHYDRKQCEKK